MTDIPAKPPDITLRAGMFTAFLVILFGANAVAVKYAMTGIGVFTSGGIRFGVAATAIGIWALVSGKKIAVPPKHILPMVLLSVIFTCQLSLFYLGLSRSNASRGTLLVNLQPFFVLFLAHFFVPGDRITLRKLVGICLGFSGVGFVFWESRGLAGADRSGDLILMGATFLWAINAVYVKRINKNYSPFQLVFYPMLLASPYGIFAGSFWDGEPVRLLNTPIVAAMAYQSLVTAAFGFVAWNGLLKKYGTVAMHSFLFIMPISGVFLGGLLLGEPITPKLIVSLFLIVTGILVVHFHWPKPVNVLPLGKNM